MPPTKQQSLKTATLTATSFPFRITLVPTVAPVTGRYDYAILEAPGDDGETVSMAFEVRCLSTLSGMLEDAFDIYMKAEDEANWLASNERRPNTW